MTIRPVLVDQKTEIEHQLLGRFERLEQELRLATPSSDGGGEQGRNRAALQALLDRQLNVAALDELKQHKLVGEAKDGQCLWIGPPDDPQRAVARRLLARENTARRALLQALIAAEPGLRPTDMPAVRRAFHRIQLALAKPGDRVQRSDGRWRTVGDSP